MAEPMSRGHDQTCGSCRGAGLVTVERAATYGDSKRVVTIQDSVTCGSCGGQGRIGGQSQ